MKKLQKKKALHVRLSWRLCKALTNTGRREGRSPSAQAAYDLELIRPVVEEETKYRITPEGLDLDPSTHELKPCLALDSCDFFIERAQGLGLSTNQYVRELLWFVHERNVLCEKREFVHTW